MAESTVAIAIKKQGLKWLESAPVTWDKLVEDLPKNQGSLMLFEIESWLNSFTIRAARLGGYLNGLLQGLNHAKSVDYSNKRVARVRKALCYTIARDDLMF